MPARGQTRGHPIYYDENTAIWRYADDDEPIAGYGGEERPCVVCGETAAEDDLRDPCLRGLPKQVDQACCGHGRDNGYILWPDTQIREHWEAGGARDFRAARGAAPTESPTPPEEIIRRLRGGAVTLEKLKEVGAEVLPPNKLRQLLERLE